MLISKKEKLKRKRLVDAQVHQGLSERLNNPNIGFLSYTQTHQWVNETYGVAIKYTTIKNYMIDFFGTKIKRPRKSHINKSKQAKADFLKLT